MAKIPFNVDAYTARLIGRENVSKLDGAIIELVKNTYDADATVCILYFDSNSNALYLADNGVGMTLEDIKKHWMTIGCSSKKNSYITDSGRIQTGAKGIGRLALDRIADCCTMLTGTETGKNKIQWTVDWSSFLGNRNITEVNADVEDTSIPFDEFMGECTNKEVVKLIREQWKSHGTIFRMTSLHETWDEKLVKSIKENLSSLIPYEMNNIYKIYCFDNTSKVEDAEVLSNVDSFSFDYKMEFSVDHTYNDSIVEYKIWRDEFAFGADEDAILQGAGLWEDKPFFHGNPIEKKCRFQDILADVSEEEISELGAFHGVLYFSKIQTTKKDREKYYQKDISGRTDVRDTFGGIKIYRDSFRVRPYGDPKSSAFDWLQLARRKNASPAGVGDEKGVWRVSVDQMMGSVFISRMNLALPDQSNREGIVETRAFRLLRVFIEKMLGLMEQDRQNVCRKLNEYYDKTHPTEDIEAEIKEKADKKRDEKNHSAGSETESGAGSNLTVDPIAAQMVIERKEEEIQELENEIKLLRALATTGIVTNTYIHEFKTLSHKLNMKIVMAKEAIDLYQDIVEAGEYINEANQIREAFNSWFQVTIEAVKNDKRKRRKVNVVQIVSKLTESWNQTLENKRIHILFQTSAEEIVLKCFPYEIETIVNNLITNSVASFGSIRKEKQEIMIFIREDDENVFMEYSDTGAGLTEKYKNHPEMILEAFETSKRNSEGEFVGTGMGMWIVNNTVMDYKGEIDLSKNIRTKEGFYVTISLKK